MTFERLEIGVEYVPCKYHVGKWYGGPGLWCGCGTQECGYCGSALLAHPTHELGEGHADDDETLGWYDDTERIVVSLADLERAFDGLIDPERDASAEAIWKRLGG